jgi:hypothetical protein
MASVQVVLGSVHPVSIASARDAPQLWIGLLRGDTFEAANGLGIRGFRPPPTAESCAASIGDTGCGDTVPRAVLRVGGTLFGVPILTPDTSERSAR